MFCYTDSLWQSDALQMHILETCLILEQKYIGTAQLKHCKWVQVDCSSDVLED